MYRTNDSCRNCVNDLNTFAECKVMPDHYNAILSSGRLCQQYVVDMGTRIEDRRLQWFQTHQNECRRECYSVVRDALNNDNDDNDGIRTIGTRVVLPSTHIGSPRDMQQRYLDAMALVRVIGRPHLFITMTCNPSWPELQIHVKSLNTVVADSPVAVARIFALKWQCFKNDIIEKQVLGRAEYSIDSKEDQTKGHSHGHIILRLILEDAPFTVEHIDNMV